MIFSIEYDKQPQDFLKKTDKHFLKRIIDKIDELLTETAVPHNAKRAAGYEEPTFRIGLVTIGHCIELTIKKIKL